MKISIYLLLCPLLALLSSLPGANLAKVPSNIASAIQTHGDTIAQRVIIDTGNLTGMHLISNKSLFSGDINQNVTAASFAVANNNVEHVHGFGPCDFITMDTHGKPAGRMRIATCAYCPGLGVNLLSVTAMESAGATLDTTAKLIKFTDGTQIPFDPDYTMSVVPTPTATANSSVITRGKDGPTHIQRRDPTPGQARELKLWADRLNGPTPATLRGLHKCVDGVPDILTRADVHNTHSDARDLADGRKMPTRERDEPIANKPGDVTAMDWWDGPCVGVLGSIGMFGCVDNNTGHIRLYPGSSKSGASTATHRYYVDAAHDGATSSRDPSCTLTTSRCSSHGRWTTQPTIYFTSTPTV